jgi:sugar phosphate isomerase/epimerase
MIFVSSSCVKASTIGQAVRKLADAGFTAIELSGGTQPYNELEQDLLQLKKEYGLYYLCHNYFPPPPQPFVINLASLDDRIAHLSMEHIRRSISLAHKLEAFKFGFHAGFRMDIPLNELGQSIARQELFDRDKAMDRFVTNLNILQKEAGSVSLYVENNVVSKVNLDNYAGINPLFVTDATGYEEMHKRVTNIQLLLDVAHLKVSCVSLGRQFDEQLYHLVNETDYIHLSDNDGNTDSNGKIVNDSALFRSLKQCDLKGKTITLEVYGGLEDLRSSRETVMELI